MKYSPEMFQEVCNHIGNGASIRDASILSNIDEKTFYNWRRDFPEFQIGLQKALTQYKLARLALIRKAGGTSWQAVAWELERRFSEEFALKTILEGSKEGTPIRMILVPPEGVK